MQDTGSAPSECTPDAKPADLRDLPLRSRFALLVLGVVLSGLVVFLFLVALVATTDRPTLAVILLLPPLIWAAVLIWRSFRRAWLRDSGPWWRVSLSEDRKGLRLEWQAQRWRDLSPWRNPTAWGHPFLLFLGPGGSVLILTHGLAHRDPEAAMSAMSWLLGVGLTFLSIIVMVSALFVPAQQKEKSRALLGSEEVYYSPPRLSHEPPPGRTDAGLGLAIGGTSFMRILTRGVRFASDGVTIIGPRRLGIVPNHFIIPTRDPEIRARIRDWAEEHRIPVSENEGPEAPSSARTAA
jgi:hypothetical protein